MEDIDKKLHEIIYSYLVNDESFLEQSGVAIPLIKQAFKDAGWTPPTIHKVDYHKQ